MTNVAEQSTRTNSILLLPVSLARFRACYEEMLGRFRKLPSCLENLESWADHLFHTHAVVDTLSSAQFGKCAGTDGVPDQCWKYAPLGTIEVLADLFRARFQRLHLVDIDPEPL